MSRTSAAEEFQMDGFLYSKYGVVEILICANVAYYI